MSHMDDDILGICPLLVSRVTAYLETHSVHKMYTYNHHRLCFIHNIMKENMIQIIIIDSVSVHKVSA